MTVPTTPVAANLDETLNVEVNLFSKLTLNLVLSVNQLSESINFFFSQLVYLTLRSDAGAS